MPQFQFSEPNFGVIAHRFFDHKTMRGYFAVLRIPSQMASSQSKKIKDFEGSDGDAKREKEGEHEESERFARTPRFYLLQEQACFLPNEIPGTLSSSQLREATLLPRGGTQISWDANKLMDDEIVSLVCQKVKARFESRVLNGSVQLLLCGVPRMTAAGPMLWVTSCQLSPLVLSEEQWHSCVEGMAYKVWIAFEILPHLYPTLRDMQGILHPGGYIAQVDSFDEVDVGLTMEQDAPWCRDNLHQLAYRTTYYRLPHVEVGNRLTQMRLLSESTDQINRTLIRSLNVRINEKKNEHWEHIKNNPAGPRRHERFQTSQRRSGIMIGRRIVFCMDDWLWMRERIVIPHDRTPPHRAVVIWKGELYTADQLMSNRPFYRVEDIAPDKILEKFRIYTSIKLSSDLKEKGYLVMSTWRASEGGLVFLTFPVLNKSPTNTVLADDPYGALAMAPLIGAESNLEFGRSFATYSRYLMFEVTSVEESPLTRFRINPSQWYKSARIVYEKLTEGRDTMPNISDVRCVVVSKRPLRLYCPAHPFASFRMKEEPRGILLGCVVVVKEASFSGQYDRTRSPVRPIVTIIKYALQREVRVPTLMLNGVPIFLTQARMWKDSPYFLASDLLGPLDDPNRVFSADETREAFDPDQIFNVWVIEADYESQLYHRDRQYLRDQVRRHPDDETFRRADMTYRIYVRPPPLHRSRTAFMMWRLVDYKDLRATDLTREDIPHTALSTDVVDVEFLDKEYCLRLPEALEQEVTRRQLLGLSPRIPADEVYYVVEDSLAV